MPRQNPNGNIKLLERAQFRIPSDTSPAHPPSKTRHPTGPAHDGPSEHKPDGLLPQPRLLRDRAPRIAWLLILIASPFFGFVAEVLVPVQILGRGDGSLGMVGTNDCAFAGAVGAPVALVFARTIYRRRMGTAQLILRTF